MADEIELKLALAEADQERFLRHPLLRHAVSKRSEQLDNIYYDTPDLALRRRGVALRLRRQGRRWLQTVKLAGKSAAGLTTRPEWETPYAGHFDFTPVEAEKIRDWLDQPRVRGRIGPVCETSFRRVTWTFRFPRGNVLLTLDRGWIAAAGRREPISEIEMELTGEDVAPIFELAAELARSLALPPALLSKAERGYRLHAGTAPVPVRAATMALERDMPSRAAFRRIALGCLEHLQHNHDGALRRDDPEYIHQMRVATRRLRAALRLFGPILPEGFAASLVAPLRDLMVPLGHARDLDVLQEEITAPVVAALPDEPRLAALAGHITDRRWSARATAVARLSAPAYGALLLQALQQLHGPDFGETQDSDTLAGFAAGRLRRLRRRVRRLAAAASIRDPASLHMLRIAIKRLRYALEFFSPLVRGKALDRTVAQLAALQDTLGQLNDLANAGALLMECAGEDPRLREAVSLIGGWHGPRHTGLLRGVPGNLKRLARLRLPGL